MPEASTARLLFVDDEASIRMTLPPVLERAGFDVRVAENVSDALFEINAQPFDILISDLNIGEEGDGFLVTSAMRHVQPDCVTFILTGYPAFETALQAIHNHVDDYLVKPVDIDSLTKTLKEKVHNRGRKQPFGTKRLAGVLKQNQGQILNQISVKQNGRPATVAKRELAGLLTAVVDQLELGTEELPSESLHAALEYGRQEAQAHHSPAKVAAQFRKLEQETLRVVQNNMTGMDLGSLVSDLRKLNASLHALMEGALDAFETPTASKPKRTVTRPTKKKR